MEDAPRNWLLNDLHMLTADVHLLRLHLSWLAQDLPLLTSGDDRAKEATKVVDRAGCRIEVAASALADLDRLLGQLRLAITGTPAV